MSRGLVALLFLRLLLLLGGGDRKCMCGGGLDLFGGGEGERRRRGSRFRGLGGPGEGPRFFFCSSPAAVAPRAGKRGKRGRVFFVDGEEEVEFFPFLG